ncbi:50S ribosomal protein L3 [Thermosulfuriphilus sp.]
MTVIEGLMGKKLGMTRIFTEEGTVIPVTIIEVGPCTVIQKKTLERDGYNALQLGFGPQKLSRLNKPMVGHLRRAGLEEGFRFIKEFKVDDPEAFEVGQRLTVVDLGITPSERVKVAGISKGRGFSGPIKRWNFKRQPMSHGAKQVHRRPGSSGASTFPGRVIKGKRMPGHYGNERVTIKNLLVADVLPEKNLVLVKGAVPGPVNGLVMIYKQR